MERTGLIAPYYRWREQQGARHMGAPPDDGRPMPPAHLIAMVSGPSFAWFSEKGRLDASAFRSLAARHGLKLERGADVLDFGCGVGRIARWLAPDVLAAGGRFYGSDLNPRLANWCAANLPGSYAVNGLRPPLGLEDAAVDLVYAHSVLTHLNEDTAQAWLAEIARVLRPGGLALMTFHDEAYAAAFAPAGVAERLAREPYIVWNNAMEGSNYLSAWTTSARLSEMAAARFETVEVVPGDVGLPAQAVGVLRKRG